jgi:hypothetical protein
VGPATSRISNHPELQGSAFALVDIREFQAEIISHLPVDLPPVARAVVRCEQPYAITSFGVPPARCWQTTLAERGNTAKFTRPYPPQTNSKVETYHWILLEEWACIHHWASDRERSDHYERFVHFYDHHRAHGALEWSTPIATLKDNVPDLLT